MRICFDLDGVICSNEGNDYAKCVPDYNMIAYLNHKYEQGHTITIQTARHQSFTEYTAIQLDLWGVNYHVLDVGNKIPADAYIDDKAINPNDIEDLS